MTVLGEAMAHGTPVVAADVGGIGGMLKHSGCLVPLFAPPEEWAGAVRSITADRDTYEFLSDACFDRCAADISWDRWAQAIVDMAWQVTADRFERDLKAAICT